MVHKDNQDLLRRVAQEGSASFSDRDTGFARQFGGKSGFLASGGGGFLSGDREAPTSPQQEALQSAQASRQTAQAKAAAVGQEHAADPDPGMLSSALRALDLPRAIAFNTGREVVDLLTGGDASMQELRQNVDERQGFGDLQALSADEDDSLMERAFKGAASFAGDVATDPFTYMGFGIAGLSKRQAGQAIKETVQQGVERLSREGAEEFGQEAMEKHVRRGLTRFREEAAQKTGLDAGVDEAAASLLSQGKQRLGRALGLGDEAPGAALTGGDDPLRQAREALGVEDVTAEADEAVGEAAEELAGEATPTGQAIQDSVDQQMRALGRNVDAATRDELVREQGKKFIGSAAAEAYETGGTKAMREYLEGLGDAGKRIWQEMPDHLKGGMRLRIPFVYNQGLKVAGGGGQLTEALGEGAEKVHKAFYTARNAIRTSRAVSFARSAVGGQAGDAYSKMLGDLVNSSRRMADDKPFTGALFEQYSLAEASLQAKKETAKELTQLANYSRGRAIAYRQTAPDIEEAEEAYRRFFMDGENMEALLRRGDVTEAEGLSGAAPGEQSLGIRVDENGIYHVDGIPEMQGLSESQMHGLISALHAHDAIRTGKDIATDLGMDINTLDAYVARVATEDAAEAFDLRKPVVHGRQSGVSGWANAKRREQYVRPVWETSEQGATTLKFRHLTPDEINEEILQREGPSSYMLFEEDPDLILGSYLNGLSTAASRQRMTNMLSDSMLTRQVSVQRPERVAPRGIAQAFQTLEPVFETLRQVDETAAEALANERTLGYMATRVLAAKGHKAQVRAAKHMVEGMRTVRNQIDNWDELVEGDRKFLAKARREFTKAIRQGEEAVSSQQLLDEEGLALSEDIGLRQIGQTEQRMQAIPPELDRTFAPQVLRDFVDQYHRVHTEPDSITHAIQKNVFQPFQTLFKTTATVARGPGYHLRNNAGGMWNNFLAGVGRKSHQSGMKIVRAKHNATRKALEEVAEEVQKNRDVQAGVLDLLDPASRRTTVAARDLVPEEALDRRVDELMRETLGGEAGPREGVSLYDVYKAGEEVGIGWRQGRHATLSPQQGEAFDAAERAAEFQKVDLYPMVAAEEKSFLQKQANNLANARWTKWGGTTAQRSEEYLRYSAFMEGVSRYGLEDGGRVASLLPKATQFDYQDLSRIERELFRGTLLPFYSWMKNNIPFQIRSFLQEPGKMMSLYHAQEAAADFVPINEEDAVPEWMKERFGFMTGLPGVDGWQPQDESRLALGVDLPSYELNELFRSSANPITQGLGVSKKLVSDANPLIKAPLEAALGVDFFTGGKTAGEYTEASPLLRFAAPFTTRSEDGEVQISKRGQTFAESTLPPLATVDRYLGMLGLSTSSRDERQASDLIAELVPGISAGTITPESRTGQAYGEADELQRAFERAPEEVRDRYTMLTEQLGLSPEEAALLMRRERAG